MAVRPDWKAGTPSALRYWLIFMIIFFVIGYDWRVAIFMGAIGGAAVLVIAAWWNAKEDDRPQKASEEPTVMETKEVTEPLTKRVHFRRYGETNKPRERRAVRRYAWWFKKKS